MLILKSFAYILFFISSLVVAAYVKIWLVKHTTIFKHRHKWQVRGRNKYGTVTYRLCFKCRENQQRVNKINEPERFETCYPIPELDAQFDEHDKFIFK